MKSLAINPHAGLAYHKLGTAYVRLGQLERALPFLRRAVELIEDARCLDSLGEALFLRGDYAGAVASFQAALRLAPEDPGLHCRLARPLARLGRAEEARTHYHAALRLDPGMRAAWSELAELDGAGPRAARE
jgi:Flp pilus assembly protein TadD